jgi:hypothetical protein
VVALQVFAYVFGELLPQAAGGDAFEAVDLGGSVGALGVAVEFGEVSVAPNLSYPSVMICSHIGSVKASRLGEAVGAW